VRNDGAIGNLAADDVVEVSCTVDADGAHPLPVDPLTPEMHALVAHVKDYERLTIAAALSGSRRDALMALLANPLVPDLDTAQPLLDALLEVNRAHLPRFWPDG
jgi:6-phospho-beta-glucosidase